MFIKNRVSTNKIIILGSNTGPKEDLTAEDIDRLDRDRGCVMIGVHYVIRRDGMVETGRELDKLGHYKRKYNKDSVYVMLIGKEDNFTEIQIEAMVEVTDELRDLYPKAKPVDLT